MSNDETPNSLGDVARERRKENRQKVDRLKSETQQAKSEIKGNPQVVSAIEKLEERIEALEDQVI